MLPCQLQQLRGNGDRPTGAGGEITALLSRSLGKITRTSGPEMLTGAPSLSDATAELAKRSNLARASTLLVAERKLAAFEPAALTNEEHPLARNSAAATRET